jgi:hypothetical protein
MDGQTAPSPQQRMGPMWKNFTLELPIVSVWFVSLDLVWVVAYLCRCISSSFLVVTLYMYFCMYQLPKWYMMSVNL